MIVKKLKSEQFKRLEKIFDEEFDSDLPEPQNSEIMAAYEDARLVGFVLVEEVKIIGQIYVIPEKREKSFNIVKNLINFVRERVAPKSVVGAVASEPRYENLYKAFGMQKIEGNFFRKNLD